MNSFPCTKCGKCCMSVSLSEKTKFLDKGDGVCKYFDSSSLLCTIYDDRPDICRIDRQYENVYKDRYSWAEFVALNLAACEYLNGIIEC